MIISPVAKNQYFKNTLLKNKTHQLVFKGQLEDNFFASIKEGNNKEAIKCLGNIVFNINETDIDTGDNFLHSAIKTGDKFVINKAIILLRQKAINDKQLANQLLNQVNYDNKKPFEYTTDKQIIEALEACIGAKLVFEQNIPIPAETYKAINEINDKDIKPLPDIDDLDDIDDVEASTTLFETTDKNIEQDKITSLKQLAGLTIAKEILQTRIIEPLNNSQKVIDSGFLLYGESGSGKSFLLKSIASVLEKEIINEKKLEQLLDEANEKQTEEILAANIIVVENVAELDNVVGIAKNNYKKTGRQTVVYIDEIKGILPDVNAAISNSVTKAEQLIEDSASNGIILIATTRAKDEISKSSIREGRFDYKIELKLPTKEERKELFEKYLINISQYSAKEIEIILNKTAGFSYLNIVKLIKRINQSDNANFENFEKELNKYVKENNLGEISAQGTTINYDTKIKRAIIKNPANFNDVAGMSDVKYQFRKNLINRLKPEQLEWFKKHNRTPIKSAFLLYGEPGTGKTFIAEALAGEINLPLYKIDGSKIKDKFVGESEKNIEAIFNQLETKFAETGEYSILFIDEADSILSKREDLNNLDSNLVNLFLQKINNSAERGIITILATNFKDKLDSAVLSRIGTKINVPLPDAEVRKAMIKLEFAKSPSLFTNISDSDIDELVARLTGFSSRDIATILAKTIDACADSPDKMLDAEDFKREINDFAISNELPEINERNKTSAYDTYLKRVKITQDDPQTLSEVGGMKEVKEKLLQVAGFDINNPDIIERYKQNKVKEQNGILLYGEPGCGKTYIMKALAAHLNLPLYEFKLSEQGSKYVHETTNNLGKIFAQLKTKYEKTGEKSILMIDEFEDIAGKRENNGFAAYKQEETDALLKEMQNARKNGIIVVAATNFYNQIDDAMKRLGRFVSIFVPLPDGESRLDIITKSLKGREIVDSNVFEQESIDKLVEITNGFSVVDITETINQFIKNSIDNRIDKLSTDDFLEAFQSRIQEKEIAKKKGK